MHNQEFYKEFPSSQQTTSHFLFLSLRKVLFGRDILGKEKGLASVRLKKIAAISQTYLRGHQRDIFLRREVALGA